MSNKNIPDPQAGGRYVRNADGSLKVVEQTEEGRRRPDHKADAATRAAQPPAPESAAAALTKNPKE